jgi:hypothetical protein
MSEKTKEMMMSDQAIGAIMMALQKSLLMAARGQPCDITTILRGFRFRLSDSGLMVMNPPLVKFDNDGEEEEEE